MYDNNKLLVVAILLGFCIISYSFQCNKRLDCTETVYNFNIGIKAFPDKDSISIGDTLWLEVIEPVKLTNLTTGQMVNYDNAANLGTAISFIQLTGNSQSKEAANDFSYLIKSGTEVPRPDTFRVREYTFEKISSNYIFKLGVICKKSGIYRISVSDAANVYRNNDNCTKAYFRINFKETNQHLHYNEENFSVVVSLPNNGYCFKVE